MSHNITTEKTAAFIKYNCMSFFLFKVAETVLWKPSLRYNVFTVCRLISSLAKVDLPHLRPLHDHSYSLISNPLQPVVCLKRDQKGLVSCHQVVTKYFTIMGECYYYIDIIYIEILLSFFSPKP